MWLFKRSIQSHTNDLGHLFPSSLHVLGEAHPKPGCEGQAVGMLTFLETGFIEVSMTDFNSNLTNFLIVFVILSTSRSINTRW